MQKVNTYDMWIVGSENPVLRRNFCGACKSKESPKWDHIERLSFLAPQNCDGCGQAFRRRMIDPLDSLRQVVEEATATWRSHCHNPSAPTIEERAYQAAKYDVLRAKMVEAKAALALAERETKEKERSSLADSVKDNIKELREAHLACRSPLNFLQIVDNIHERLNDLRHRMGSEEFMAAIRDLIDLRHRMGSEEFMAAIRDLIDSGE